MDGLTPPNPAGDTGQNPNLPTNQPTDQPTNQPAGNINQPAPENSSENQNFGLPSEMEKPSAGGSKIFITILVIILVLVVLGGGGYYAYIKYFAKKSETNTSTVPAPVSETTPATEKSNTIATNYEKTTAVEATGSASQTVDTVLQPILKKVFDNKIKLKEDLGQLLTYVTNREITAVDVTAVKIADEANGAKAVDVSEKQITMTKGSSTWVISFSVGSTEKATIEVTY